MTEELATETAQATAEAPPKKNRRFLFGCATGGVLMLVIQVAIFVIAFLIARPNLVETAEKKLLDIDIPLGKVRYSWELTNTAGEKETLEHLRGQIAVIHLWKPGCPHCEAVVPSIESLAQKIGPYGVEFLMVCATDAPDFAERAAEVGITLPVYGLPGKFPKWLEPHVAPTTFVINREGKVVLRRNGSARWDTDDAVAFFEQLVADG